MRVRQAATIPNLIVTFSAVGLELAHVMQLRVHCLQLRLARRARRLIFLVQRLLPRQLLHQLGLCLLVAQLHFLDVALPQRVPVLLVRQLVRQLMFLQRR
jgi:hypothetical protein